METQARLIVDVARLDKGGEVYRGELPPEALDYQDDEFITPAGPIRYDLFVEDLQTELLVRGKVSQVVRCICSRCAEPFELDAGDPEFLVSLEISQRTDFVDLTAELREAIILSFPGYPVCHEACKGLCPHCGKNLNDGPCLCGERESEGGAFSNVLV